MKKTWTAFAVTLLMVCGIAAFGQQPGEAPLFAVKATMLTEGETIFKTGVIIPLKLVLTCPETHQAGSWRAVAYLRDIPKDFEKRPGFTVNQNRDPKWSFMETDQGYWFPVDLRKNKEFEVTINTEGWPAGDYRMSIRITFQPLEQEGEFIYRNSPITFTLEN